MTVPARHPSTTAILRWFDHRHLPAGTVRETSHLVGTLARDLAERLPDSPELTAGLRKLLEAKDCMVRATIAAESEIPSWTDR